MVRFGSVLSLSLLLYGCTFDAAGVPAGDLGPGLDRGGDRSLVDLHAALDARREGGAPDGPRPDGPGLDGPGSDTPLPDAPLSDAPLSDAPLPDALLPDAPLPDAPLPDAPLPDAPLPDAPLPDAPLPDAPLPDAPLPDALVDASVDAAVAACKAKYGAAPGYLLCWVTSSGCAFNATTNGTCTAMCQTYGGTCLGAYDNSNGCSIAGADPCSKSRNTNVCICSM